MYKQTPYLDELYACGCGVLRRLGPLALPVTGRLHSQLESLSRGHRDGTRHAIAAMHERNNNKPS